MTGDGRSDCRCQARDPDADTGHCPTLTGRTAHNKTLAAPRKTGSLITIDVYEDGITGSLGLALIGIIIKVPKDFGGLGLRSPDRKGHSTAKGANRSSH